MEKLIERLKWHVSNAENDDEDMDSVSWGMQEGILISYNEAKMIIKEFELLKKYSKWKKNLIKK